MSNKILSAGSRSTTVHQKQKSALWRTLVELVEKLYVNTNSPTACTMQLVRAQQLNQPRATYHIILFYVVLVHNSHLYRKLIGAIPARGHKAQTTPKTGKYYNTQKKTYFVLNNSS